MNVDIHKVFISYYHKDDQDYKDELINKQIFDTEKHQFKSIQVVFDLQQQGFSHQQHLGKQHSAHQLRSRLGIVFIVFLVVDIVL